MNNVERNEMRYPRVPEEFAARFCLQTREGSFAKGAYYANSFVTGFAFTSSRG